MKVLSGDCSCGMNGCNTTFELRQDNENEHNTLLIIKDDKHEIETWISFDKEDLVTIFKFLRSKYGRLE